jgi:transcriptional regulator with XRE-family HTH domain
MTQRRLAKIVGVSVITVQEWEAGRDIPTMIHLIRLAREFGFRLAIIDRTGQESRHAGDASAEESWESREIRRLALTLRALRVRADIVQSDLAVLLGVSEWSITRWESFQGNPRPIGLFVWAEALGGTVRLLRGGCESFGPRA